MSMKKDKDIEIEGYPVKSLWSVFDRTGHSKVEITRTWADAGKQWVTSLSSSRIGYVDMSFDYFRATHEPYDPMATNGIGVGSQWVDKSPNEDAPLTYTVMSVIGKAGKCDDVRYVDTSDNMIVYTNTVDYFLENLSQLDRGTPIKKGDRWLDRKSGNEIIVMIVGQKIDNNEPRVSYFYSDGEYKVLSKACKEFEREFIFSQSKTEKKENVIVKSEWRCLCNEKIKKSTILETDIDNGGDSITFLTDTVYGFDVNDDGLEWFLENHVLIKALGDHDKTKEYSCRLCNKSHKSNSANGHSIREYGICKYCDLSGKSIKSNANAITDSNKADKCDNRPRYFYVTFSQSIGGKNRVRQGALSVQTPDNRFFDASHVENIVAKNLKVNKEKILIQSWVEMNKSDFNDFNGDKQ